MDMGKGKKRNGMDMEEGRIMNKKGCIAVECMEG